MSVISTIAIQVTREHSKSYKGIPIYGDMAGEFEMKVAAANSNCAFFVQDDGKPVYDFEKAWKKPCRVAGIPDLLYTIFAGRP